MKTILSISISFICSIILFSCSSSNVDSSKKFSAGKYNCIFTDSLDSKVVEGEMTIDSVGLNFIGIYKTTKTVNADYPGVSHMSGEFQGGFNETSKLYGFNMNPKVADANVFVTAKWINGKLKGTWTYSTMMGIRAKGNFEAVRKE